MILEPLLIDEDKSKDIFANPGCQQLFDSYPAYYHKTGYNPPWIAYWVIRDGIVVGGCGFTGAPQAGRLEIAYGTFKNYEGQGISTFACNQLIRIAKANDSELVITAKTSPEENASCRILKKNGFEFTGIVQDEGIGDAWQWIHQESTP